jgi:putative component of membrane protein insertase Oxa1/YidC/SpoIIIJ protein YidD
MPPRTAFALAFALSFVSLSAYAQDVSAEDQAACQFDAQTYCQEAIPDHGRVRACLVKNRRVISPACRAAMERKPARRRPGR